MWVRVGNLIQAALEFEGPAYDPPYESPIEDAFAWHIVKHLDAAATLVKQVEVETICGGFRIDFIASAGGRRIAFECDGAEYHNQLRDECRDAVILWSGFVDSIYRLRGADLHYRVDDVLVALVTAEPGLFSSRGRRNVEHLARGTTVRSFGTALFADRAVGDDERAVFPIRIERHSLDSHFLRDFADFASRRAGRLDTVISAFLNRAAGEVA
jgi:hypothetical protein